MHVKKLANVPSTAKLKHEHYECIGRLSFCNQLAQKLNQFFRVRNYSIWRESLTSAPGARAQPSTCQPHAKETAKTAQTQPQGNPTLPGTTGGAGEPVGAEEKGETAPQVTESSTQTKLCSNYS